MPSLLLGGDVVLTDVVFFFLQKHKLVLRLRVKRTHREKEEETIVCDDFSFVFDVVTFYGL